MGLSFLVFIHEMGHYLFARRCGVFVYEFAVGFGPRVWSRRNRKSGTIWSFRAIPLGGFVRMLGSMEAEDTQPSISVGSRIYIRVDDEGRVDTLYLYDPGETEKRELGKGSFTWYEGMVRAVDFKDSMTISLDVQEKGTSSPRSFPVLVGAGVYSGSGSDKTLVRVVPPHLRYDAKGRGKRVLVSFAGPLFNILLAIPLLFFYTGVSDKDRLFFDDVLDSSPAMRAGIQPGDALEKVSNFEVMGRRFSQNAYVKALGKNEPMILTVRGADDQRRDVELIPKPLQEGRKISSFSGMMSEIGVTYDFRPQTIRWLDIPRISFAHAAWMAESTWDSIVGIFTKGIPLYGPERKGGGPLLVIKMLVDSTKSLNAFLYILANLSFVLAFFNLIPFIPVLDGGRIFLLLIEAIRRKPNTPRVEMVLAALGFFLMILFFVYVSIGDIIHLVNQFMS